MTALQIILARTEKDQLGLSVAQWFAERARVVGAGAYQLGRKTFPSTSGMWLLGDYPRDAESRRSIS